PSVFSPSLSSQRSSSSLAVRPGWSCAPGSLVGCSDWRGPSLPGMEAPSSALEVSCVVRVLLASEVNRLPTYVPRDCSSPCRGAEQAVEAQKRPASLGHFRVIGETGFEPATARPPAGCATRLRHSPWLSRKRATGIEPALEAWKASVQPQHFARSGQTGS